MTKPPKPKGTEKLKRALKATAHVKTKDVEVTDKKLARILRRAEAEHGDGN